MGSCWDADIDPKAKLSLTSNLPFINTHSVWWYLSVVIINPGMRCTVSVIVIVLPSIVTALVDPLQGCPGKLQKITFTEYWSKTYVKAHEVNQEELEYNELINEKASSFPHTTPWHLNFWRLVYSNSHPIRQELCSNAAPSFFCKRQNQRWWLSTHWPNFKT